MNPAVEELLASPALPEIVDQLQARLTEERARRERFYADVNDDVKVEFINGEIVMHSPSRDRHTEVRHHLHVLLELDARLRGLGIVRGEKSLCVFPRNDYEPDVCFFGSDKARLIDTHTVKYPPPDFIAEVLSESTAARDRGDKFADYAAHNVGEYWIVDPDQEILEQYVVREGRYHLALKSGTGEVRSVVVPGFCIPIRALFDPQLNLKVLRELLTR